MFHNHEILHRGFGNFLHVRKVQIRPTALFCAAVTFLSSRSTFWGPPDVSYSISLTIQRIAMQIVDLRLWVLALGICAS